MSDLGAAGKNDKHGTQMEKDPLEIFLEDISNKLDLVLECQSALDRKFDRRFDELNQKVDHNSFMIGVLNKKIDAVAADFSAHRADSESHHGIYRVKESKEDFGTP